MNIKTLILFFVFFALGGAVTYVIGGLLSGGEAGKPVETSRQGQPARPGWMAAPGSEKPLKRQDQAKAASKKDVAERQRILKVGVIGPETGDGAVFGLSVVKGVQMAAERFNAEGGIGGKGVEVIHRDNKGGGDLTREIFSDFANQGVLAVFSAPTGWSTFAPTHLANRTKTILISVGARRNIGRSGDYVFQFSLPDDVAIDDLLRFSIKELGYKDYALVTSSANDYSLNISARFKQLVPKRGGVIRVDADTYDTFLGKRNIAAVIKALKNAPSPLQALIFTGDAEEAALMIRAVAEAGLKLPLIGGEDLFTGDFLKKGGAAARGTLLYTTFSPDDKTPQTAEFLEAYARGQKGVPNRFTALAYDAFASLAAAAKDSGSLASSKVREALLNRNETTGVTGATSWTPEGVALKHPFIYRIEADGNSQKFVLLRSGE